MTVLEPHPIPTTTTMLFRIHAAFVFLLGKETEEEHAGLRRPSLSTEQQASTT